MTCPDPNCGKDTDGIDACEHCGCPLTEEALTALVEGLANMTNEMLEERDKEQ